MNKRGALIIGGLKLAIEIKRNLKQLILLNQVAGIVITQERLKDIVQAIEMLKAIEIEYKTKKFLINQWVVLINRYTTENINFTLVKGIKNIQKLKSGPVKDDMCYLI